MGTDDVKISQMEYDLLRQAAGQLEIMRSLGFQEVTPPSERKAKSCSHYKGDLDALTGCKAVNGKIVCDRCDWVSGWTIHNPGSTPEACAGYDTWDFGLPNADEDSPQITSFDATTLPHACGLASVMNELKPESSGCLIQWNPGNDSNRNASTDDTQQRFYAACMLAKQQIHNKSQSTAATVTTHNPSLRSGGSLGGVR